MAWKELHELDTRNGRMRLVKFFNSQRLLAEDGTEQSGSYMNSLWKTALRTLPKKFSPSSILFLGVGTGGALRIAAKKFPSANITGIEWDSTLKNIAEQSLTSENNTTLIEADAEIWTKTMPHTNITCIDLFTGADVAPCVRKLPFLQHVIAHSDFTFINVYTHQDILREVDNTIAHLPRKRIQYYASTIGMYGSSHLCS
jgi:spermidine synthase